MDGQLPFVSIALLVPVPSGNLPGPGLDPLQVLPAFCFGQDLEQLLLHPAHILGRVSLASHYFRDLHLAP